MNRLLLILAITCTLCGCAPIPYFRHHAPELSGVVHRAGQPVAGAHLEVSSLLEGEQRTALSEADGHFVVESIDQFRFTTPLLGDPLIRYRLDIIAAGVRYLGYERAAMGNHLPPVQLDCDLTRATDAETPACEAQFER